MNNQVLIFTGDVVGKPRMTKKDKWKARTATSKYWAFKDLLTIIARQQRFTLSNRISIEVEIAMPKSWTPTRKKAMSMQPHMQKPDIDNILKSIQDILLKDDSGIWEVHIIKRWTIIPESRLIIINLGDE